MSDALADRVSDADADVETLTILSGAAVLGLIVSAGAIAIPLPGGLAELAMGLLYLTPGVILAVILHERHAEDIIPGASGVSLFVTLLGANTAALAVRLARMGFMDVIGLLLALGVGLIFVPGPFTAVWVARRWFL